MFIFLDVNKDGHIDLSEIVRGVALFCRKVLEDRLKGLYNVYYNTLVVSISIIIVLYFLFLFNYRFSFFFPLPLPPSPSSSHSLLSLPPSSLLSFSVCFELFDEDKDGYLSKAELLTAIKLLLELKRSNSKEREGEDDTATIDTILTEHDDKLQVMIIIIIINKL